MLGVILMESFKQRQGMNVKDTAKEAGSIVGFNEKKVRRHRKDNKGYLSESKRGKYERHANCFKQPRRFYNREGCRTNIRRKSRALSLFSPKISLRVEPYRTCLGSIKAILSCSHELYVGEAAPDPQSCFGFRVG